MKKAFRSVAMVLVLVMSFGVLSSCYGSFRLFKAFHGWNGSIGNKWVKEIVYLLTFWNVYGLCVAVDFFILNTIEFWTGSNPLAMAPGETETQLVKNESGDQFQITATMNRFDITQLTGANTGHETALVYEPDTRTWFVENSYSRVPVAIVDGNKPDLVSLLNAQGEPVQQVQLSSGM